MWHERQAGTVAAPGGPAGASGPCGRWQLAQGTGAWGPRVFCTWQVVHCAFGVRALGCASWQLVHFEWPSGAVFASSVWQLPHVGLGAVGAWASWQSLQVVWPWPPEAAAAAVSRAWQVVHCAFGIRALGCASWQLVHFEWPSGAVFASSVWQLPQVGFGAAGAWASWQSLQVVWPLPPDAAAAAASRAWHVEHEGGANACGLWQVSHEVLPSWKARSLAAFVWQWLHVTGEGALG